MGIRGLATFVARNSDKYLEDYKLKDCYLVIDGNSLACQLYAKSPKFNSAFGGDYDRYATYVNEFFNILRKCRITPLVVFDGGYEKGKLRTTFSRMKQKWATAKQVTPMSQHRNIVFPCFLKEVFKDVIRKLHIPFAHSLFEADAEIAAIARYLECPVLSYDSDFFVYNILYIPFPTVYLNPCKDMSVIPEVTYYVSCSLYRVENFLKRSGGLQKEILPFLSIMLGCDYVGGELYRRFVSNLKKKKKRGLNRRQRRIGSLLAWLRTETFESVKSKVLGCLRKERRTRMTSEIKSIVSMYTKSSSDLLPFLGIEVCENHIEISDQMNTVTQLLEEQHDLEDSEQWIVNDPDPNEHDESTDETYSNKDSESESSNEISDIDNIDEDNEELQSESPEKHTNAPLTVLRRKASSLPEWFCNCFRQGDFPSAFMDMIVLNNYFVPPLLEDYDYPSSNIISLPIIAVVYGLLISPEFRTSRLLRCHIRECGSNNYIDVTPVHESVSVKFPSLEDLPNLLMSDQLLILMETAGLNSVDQKIVISLPLSWQLYTVALIFWVKQTEQPVVNSSHISALLLCLILLDVARNNEIKRVKHDVPYKEKEIFEVKELQESLNLMNETLKNLNSEECIRMKKLLQPWRLLDEKLKTRPKLYCVTTVHSFSQFQSCLLHFTYLNALLRYPLPHCIAFDAFSGTFVYNIYNNLKQRTNASEYISHLLSTVPSLLALFTVLREVVEHLIPKIPSTNRVRRKSRKRKRQVEKTEETTNDADVDLSVDSDFEDPNNRFSALVAKH